MNLKLRNLHPHMMQYIQNHQWASLVWMRASSIVLCVSTIIDCVIVIRCKAVSGAIVQITSQVNAKTNMGQSEEEKASGNASYVDELDI